jgi:carbonic anhydrase
MADGQAPKVVSATDALARLRAGNQRYVNNVRSNISLGEEVRAVHAKGQHPFAIILSCSDSRVPPELVFDQGLGDLFVIRVAGNVVVPSLLGSAEFAASAFGSRLVVVMGHSLCGAIKATLGYVRDGKHVGSDNIQDIINNCDAPVRKVVEGEPEKSNDQLLSQAVRANVRQACERLHQSGLLKQLMADEGLRIVGAEYSLETGAVEFFEGV